MSNRGNPRGGGGASRGGGRGGGGPPRGGSGGGGGGGRGDGGRGGYGGGGGGRGRGGAPQIFAAGTPPRIDSRLASADKAVAANRAAVTPYEPRNPLRPGFGTLGAPIVLRANFFAVKLPKTPIFEYNVEIEPSMLNKNKGRLYELLEKTSAFAPHVSYIAHDRGARMVAARKLPEPLAVPVQYFEEGIGGPKKTYTVTIKLTGELDPSGLQKYLNADLAQRNYDTLPLISALNLVLQQHASRTGFRVGKNRYFFEGEKFNLGMGVNAWKGFFLSVRPAFGQLMVNVNVCMSAFYEPGNLVDAIGAFQRNSRGALPARFVQRLTVRTKHLGHKKAVKRICTTNARNTFFEFEGRRISVEEYFRLKHPNLPLRFADKMPVVDLGPKTDPKKTVYVPAELCEIVVGTAYAGKLDSNETAQMIKYACKPPAVNAEAIVHEGLPKLGLVPSASPQGPLAAFGVEVSGEMTVIPARVLPPPGLSYKSGGRPNVRDGGWNILDVKFQRGASLAPGWAVCVVRDGPPQRIPFSSAGDPGLVDLIQGFKQKLLRAGMTVPADPKVFFTEGLPGPNHDPDRKRSLALIKQAFTQNLNPKAKPSFVLVLLCMEDDHIYPGVKHLGDVVLGVNTVCMLLTDRKALVSDPKKRDQYYSNVALKVNTKLGGVNHLLDDGAMAWLRDRRTMVCGADVTHPRPGAPEGTPSIAALVASVDKDFVQYPASMCVQQPDPTKASKEMIEDMKEMMTERLLLYKKKNKVLPEKIILYRDGVSEGQFDLVLQYELPKIEQAFVAVYGVGAALPKLSIVICGKRHHARPLPTSAETASDNGNTRPGTVVDKGITDVYRYDFYLQAHKGLQGTVRSTHYTVVYDQNQLPVDTLQQGTHTSSYSYARATKAVSLIPPAYYADLCAERGRLYLNEIMLAVNDDKSTATRESRDGERRRVADAAKLAWGRGVHDDIKETMYYI